MNIEFLRRVKSLCEDKEIAKKQARATERTRIRDEEKREEMQQRQQAELEAEKLRALSERSHSLGNLLDSYDPEDILKAVKKSHILGKCYGPIKTLNLTSPDQNPSAEWMLLRTITVPAYHGCAGNREILQTRLLGIEASESKGETYISVRGLYFPVCDSDGNDLGEPIWQYQPQNHAEIGRNLQEAILSYLDDLSQPPQPPSSL